MRWDCCHFTAYDVTLNPQPTDIYQLFKRIGSSLADKTEARLQLRSNPYWNVDSDLFDRLVQNLLTNALKYQSPDRSLKVTVTYKKNAKTSELHITDNDRGMPSNLADQAFTLFTRLDPNSAPGNGLGLAICRKIIRLHKGEINVSAPKEELVLPCHYPATLRLTHEPARSSNRRQP